MYIKSTAVIRNSTGKKKEHWSKSNFFRMFLAIACLIAFTPRVSALYNPEYEINEQRTDLIYRLLFNNVVHPEKSPVLVYIQNVNDGFYDCSGVMISPTVILTSTSCVDVYGYDTLPLTHHNASYSDDKFITEIYAYENSDIKKLYASANSAFGFGSSYMVLTPKNLLRAYISILSLSDQDFLFGSENNSKFGFFLKNAMARVARGRPPEPDSTLR